VAGKAYFLKYFALLHYNIGLRLYEGFKKLLVKFL